MKVLCSVLVSTLLFIVFPLMKVLCSRARGVLTARTKVEPPGLTFTPSTDTQLKIIQLNNESLLGIFISKPDVIINFKSTCLGLVHVWRADGTTIYKVESTPQNYLVEFGGHQFIGMRAFDRQQEGNGKRNQRKHTDKLKFNEAFGKFLGNPVSRLFANLSRALGKAGVFGHVSPCSLSIYATALLITRQLPFKEQDADVIEEKPDCSSQQEHQKLSTQRVRRSCSLENDPNKDKCQGMCGRRCWCWSWVCGDCCYHRGCDEHDKCCGANGYFSISCLDIFKFSCDSFGDYPSCLR